MLPAPGADGRCGTNSQLRLTRRQRDILDLVGAGLTDKEIAVRLRVSVTTIRTHLRRFYQQNGVRNRAHAAAAFQRDERG